MKISMDAQFINLLIVGISNTVIFLTVIVCIVIFYYQSVERSRQARAHCEEDENDAPIIKDPKKLAIVGEAFDASSSFDDGFPSSFHSTPNLKQKSGANVNPDNLTDSNEITPLLTGMGRYHGSDKPLAVAATAPTNNTTSTNRASEKISHKKNELIKLNFINVLMNGITLSLHNYAQLKGSMISSSGASVSIATPFTTPSPGNPTSSINIKLVLTNNQLIFYQINSKTNMLTKLFVVPMNSVESVLSGRYHDPNEITSSSSGALSGISGFFNLGGNNNNSSINTFSILTSEINTSYTVLNSTHPNNSNDKKKYYILEASSEIEKDALVNGFQIVLYDTKHKYDMI